MIVDKWKILEIYDGDTIIYKLLIASQGGYLDEDRWRLNSGIKSFEEKLNEIIFDGYSGSSYICHKNNEGFTILSASIYDKVKNKVKSLNSDAYIRDVNYEDFKINFKQ